MICRANRLLAVGMLLPALLLVVCRAEAVDDRRPTDLTDPLDEDRRNGNDDLLTLTGSTDQQHQLAKRPGARFLGHGGGPWLAKRPGARYIAPIRYKRPGARYFAPNSNELLKRLGARYNYGRSYRWKREADDDEDRRRR